MSTKGSCLCGDIQISYACEPVRKGLCHCAHCKKITGSAYSTNVLVPTDLVTVTGEPKKYALTTSGSGLLCEIYFCGRCGATLFSRGEALPGMSVLKAGTLDNVENLEKAKPEIEIFVRGRLGWVGEIEGSTQFENGLPAR